MANVSQALDTRCFSKHLTRINSLNLHDKPLGWALLCSPFTEKETEAQRTEVTLPGSVFPSFTINNHHQQSVITSQSTVPCVQLHLNKRADLNFQVDVLNSSLHYVYKPCFHGTSSRRHQACGGIWGKPRDTPTVIDSIQAHVGDTAGLVPDHRNKAYLAIKRVTRIFCFPSA